MLALYRQETIILHSIGFKIMGFMAFTCSKPRKPDTFSVDQTLPGCEASCMYKLPSGSRQTRPIPPPPPPQPPADSCRRCIEKKKKRARVAKREKEPAVAHDALRLISLKNTLDTKTIWENMYSVIEKAAVIEKIPVYFFIVVVIIIIFIFLLIFFFTELLSQKILRN